MFSKLDVCRKTVTQIKIFCKSGLLSFTLSLISLRSDEVLSSVTTTDRQQEVDMRTWAEVQKTKQQSSMSHWVDRYTTDSHVSHDIPAHHCPSNDRYLLADQHAAAYQASMHSLHISHRGQRWLPAPLNVPHHRRLATHKQSVSVNTP